MLLYNSFIQGLLTTQLGQSDRVFSEKCVWRDVEGCAVVGQFLVSLLAEHLLKDLRKTTEQPVG